MSDWLESRHATYRQKLANRKLREQQWSGAIGACAAMLGRLKGQVWEDVREYNALFCKNASDQKCMAHGEDLSGGSFSVSVGSSSVRVTRQPDTAIICFEYFGEAAKIPANCVESYPNEEGKVGYWYGKDNSFVDEKQLSQIILEPILCG